MSKISNLMSPLKIKSWSAKEVLNFTHEREISILLHVIDITLKFMVPLQVKLEHSHTEQATLNRQRRGGRAAALSSSSIPRLPAAASRVAGKTYDLSPAQAYYFLQDNFAQS